MGSASVLLGGWDISVTTPFGEKSSTKDGMYMTDALGLNLLTFLLYSTN